MNNHEGYFWENSTDDLKQNIVGRYKMSGPGSYTVALIKRVRVGNEMDDVYHVKIIANSLPFECSTQPYAESFVEMWFRTPSHEQQG